MEHPLSSIIVVSDKDSTNMDTYSECAMLADWTGGLVVELGSEGSDLGRVGVAPKGRVTSKDSVVWTVA